MGCFSDSRPKACGQVRCFRHPDSEPGQPTGPNAIKDSASFITDRAAGARWFDGLAHRYNAIPGQKPGVGTCAGLIALSANLYQQLRRAAFVNLDDPVYVSANPVTQSGVTVASVKSAFTSVAANYWHPVTWLSHALDCELFGLDAGLHHVTSVVLHSATLVALAMLLFAITRKYWPILSRNPHP